MEIRKSKPEDLDRIMAIYARARDFMASTGNPKQWGTNKWPPRELVENDIAVQKSYVCIENDEVEAVFYYDFGPHVEPCYDVIHEGRWSVDSPYGVVHRIASSGKCKGAGAFCITWAFEQSGHLRIDTHPDNHVMQKLLGKLGFSRCGIIYVKQDPDPRLAFEKISRPTP